MTTLIEQPEQIAATTEQVVAAIKAATKNQATATIRIDGKAFYNAVARLCEIADANLERTEYFVRCFKAIAKHFGTSVGVLNLRLGARTIERRFSIDEALTNQWVEEVDPLVLRAQTDQTTLTQVYRNGMGEDVAYSLVAPIQKACGKSKNGTRAIGAVALVINKPTFQEAEAELIQLGQLLELVVENAPTANATANAASKAETNALQTVVRASDYRSINHLSFAIVNSLCNKFHCEQVSIGLVRNRNVRLMAVSGMSEIPRNTPGMMAIQQAMAACSDRNETTVVQLDGRQVDQVESSSCKIHQFWHKMTGESSVATLPLRINGECVAVISLRRQSNEPFVQEDLQRVQMLAESFAPALPLVDRASRSVVRHLCESFAATLSQLYTWNQIGPKVATACLCAAMAWMVFGKIEYHVRAHCRIVPEQVYTVSVPHEGMISHVYVLPGQRVNDGDLLVQLDTNDLLIERRSLQASIVSTQIEANAMLTERKNHEAFLLQAEIKVLETDLSLINEQIERSQIRAHQDGVVMPTKIHQRVGQFVALGEELLEIANEDKWHLEVEIPEANALYIETSQHGEFQSIARPDQQLVCEVTKISPSSQVLNHRNVVVVEAVLLERDDWMKLGMEGNVRLNAGRKPVWWVFSHPMLDYMRLKLWL